MADDKATDDVREYLIVNEQDSGDGGVVWKHLAKVRARSHDEALRTWAIANPEAEQEYPHFHVVTGSAVKGPLKGKQKPTYVIG